MKADRVFSAEDFDDLADFVEEALMNQNVPEDAKKQISDLFEKAKKARGEIAEFSTAIDNDLETIQSLKFRVSARNRDSREAALSKKQIRDLRVKISRAEMEMRKAREQFLLYTFNLEEKAAEFRQADVH